MMRKGGYMSNYHYETGTWNSFNSSTASSNQGYSTSTWNQWVTCTSGTTSTTDTSWNSWSGNNGCIVGADTAGTPNTWYVWNDDTPSFKQEMLGDWNIQQPKTKAELAVEKRQTKEAEAKRLAEEKKRKEAEDRSYKLLQSFLDDKQLEELDKTKSFFMLTDDGKMFKISKGVSHNIKEVEKINDKEVKIKRSICRHIRDDVPVYDNMLAQYLELQDNWKHFVDQANCSQRNDRERLPATRR